MGVGPRDLRVHQRRSLPRAAIFRGAPQNRVARQRIAAVALLQQKAGKIGHQLRDASARRLKLHRNGNRPAVVFDQEKNRKFAQAGGIQPFEKFPFARRTVAARNVHDFVRLVAHMLAERRLLGLLQRAAETVSK